MHNNQPVSGREARYPNNWHLITTTNLDSYITAVNEDFLEVAGYTEDELIGQPHNIIRHPDMPTGAFADMWATIQAGHSWRGMVKNRCKNGDHYWVDAFVTPITKDGQTVEYQSVRTRPTDEQIARAEKVYRTWREGHLPSRFMAKGATAWQKASIGLIIGLVLATAWGWWAGAWLGSAVASGLLAGLYLATLWWLQPINHLVTSAREHTHPVMPYLYTGRRDDAAWLTYDREKRNAVLRAVSARMYSNVGSLQGRKMRTMKWVSGSVETIRSQQNDIQSISQAFDELQSSVDRVAELTATTHNATLTASQSAAQSQRNMAEVNRAMSDLSERLRSAEKDVLELSEKSNDINIVLEVISSIADQTNLLALNAAIEAARAGEAGRGFAVVADEVRGLAQRTHTSTKQITDIIDGLQRMTQSVVVIIKDGAQASADTAHLIEQAHAGIDQTLENIDMIGKHSEEVASATEQQSALSLQVSGQAANLARLGDSSVNSSESARQESEQLGASVDQAYLLSSHFLSMMCGRLRKPTG